MSDTLVTVTDSTGVLVLEGEDATEPLPGSVILTEGPHGTAWQRFFTDGKWHRVSGGPAREWRFFLTKRNVVLVYDAPPREEGR